MPKRATNRRGGAVEVSPPRRSARVSPSLGSSILPNIPTKTSFAYGSSTTPILPHMLAAKPSMNLEETADSIEDAVQIARQRELSESTDNPHLSASSRRRTPVETGSPRRARRQPTPDEVQLLTSLNEASSATPSTPVRHSFSSGTSPRDSFAQQLYPSAMEREALPIQAEIPLDHNLNGLGLDNMSVVSYNVERDIHDDDLKRTRSNITAPPRRFSGLAFGHSTIIEEDEPSYASRPQSDKSTSDGVPTRTTIPDRSYEEPPPEKKPESPPSPPKARRARKSPPKAESAQQERGQREQPKPKDGHPFWLLQVLVAALAVLAFYSFMPKGATYPEGSTPIQYNNSELDGLSNQVVNLGAQVSTLSKDVKSVRAEVSRIPAPTTIFQYPNKNRQETLKTNFLSMGHGVIIDPYMTSPSAGRQLTWFQESYFWLAGNKHLRPQPPLAALTPWEDFGECWCSAPRQGMSQIGIILGRRIVPEDVIVEHLPKTATIRPEVAPQEMELWARYRYIGKNARPYKSSWSSWIRGYPENIAGQDALASDRKVVRGPVMEALRLTWRGEPDEAFSDDKLLGEDFYRIGKWTYDIHEKTHIQRFPVTALLDSDELRVDKVVFRVKSNWGANETCIYRLKLHGKL
ncbi:uncharacterized protein BDV17DRAFT_257714 [Aspergillus undulatus]|uniref:uncharacterized protein n=1 Tax=Aspergillus undulatus TaxID=1810928 RepID=UPI003CCE3525